MQPRPLVPGPQLAYEGAVIQSDVHSASWSVQHVTQQCLFSSGNIFSDICWGSSVAVGSGAAGRGEHRAQTLHGQRAVPC